MSSTRRLQPQRRALLLAGAALIAWPVRAATTPRAPLLPGFDNTWRMPTETRVALAQRYHDQGVLLAFGFNPAEAARSLETAVALDPRCASSWWALAWALGPTINADLAPLDEARVLHALWNARHHAARARPAMRDLIAALSLRHPRAGVVDEEAYAKRLQVMARRHWRDATVAVLAAEALMNLHPYDWWTRDGQPQPWTPAIERLLARALALDARHPGAHHYAIHLYESSPEPARGAASADALRALVPGSGHLLHMPAHIDLRTGRYAQAIAASRRAIAADERYLAAVDAQGAYRVGYVAHNHHYLWAAAAMAGDFALALQAAEAAYPAACGPSGLDPGRAIAQHYAVLPLLTRLRFGRWDAVLRDVRPPDAPGAYVQALWHYARATAHARRGERDAALRERARFDEAAVSPLVAPLKMKNLNPASSLLRIAQLTLAADLASTPADAVPLLEEAVRVEDGFAYDEPHLWLAPTRHALGAALLAAGAARRAEQVYREDLRHYPDNGWSLHGLAAALEAQGRTDAARQSRAAARRAFGDGARALPATSRF